MSDLLLSKCVVHHMTCMSSDGIWLGQSWGLCLTSSPNNVFTSIKNDNHWLVNYIMWCHYRYEKSNFINYEGW
jgi:hypothetical protein